MKFYCTTAFMLSDLAEIHCVFFQFQHLIERSWYAVTETCLAFTVFRDDFSPKFVASFTLLLFLKCFHWLAEDRVDYVSCKRWEMIKEPQYLSGSGGFECRSLLVQSSALLYERFIKMACLSGAQQKQATNGLLSYPLMDGFHHNEVARVTFCRLQVLV